MGEKKRFKIDKDSLNSLPKERQELLLAVRTLMVPIMRDLLMLLHTTEAVLPDEELSIDIVADCGFDAVLTLGVNTLGVCEDPDKDEKIQILKDSAFRALKASKGAAMHGVTGAGSLDDVERIIRERIEARKKQTTSEEEKDRFEKITETIDQIVAERKSKRKERPKSKLRSESEGLPPPPKPSELGFLD